LAARDRVARGVGTWVLVSAGEDPHHLADPVQTRVVGGADVAVITGSAVGRELTTPAGAAVVGAWVLIVTDGGRALDARAILALISHGTGVSIVTWTRRGLMGAAAVWEAAVEGAGILIVARQRALALAGAALAEVSCGALVAVVTQWGVGSEATAELWVAGVIGAEVSIVAGQDSRAGSAGPVHADVSDGTHVAVVARVDVWDPQASGFHFTDVGRTGVCVVALQTLAQARPLGAYVVGRAGVFVVARSLGGLELAALVGSTQVGRAGVSVVTSEGRLTRLTGALCAGIAPGTHIAVITQGGVVGEHAAAGPIAGVIGAGIFILT
jgi:hypothetical protein